MKRKKTLKILLFLIILVILLLIVTCNSVFNSESINNNQINIERQVLNDENNDEDSYFELNGYGDIYINKNNRFINLSNSLNNTVYLEYKVFNNEVLLFQTGLIEPGKMEQYDAYAGLDSGEVILSYSINVYDENKKVLWNNITQKQNVFVNKKGGE